MPLPLHSRPEHVLSAVQKDPGLCAVRRCQSAVKTAGVRSLEILRGDQRVGRQGGRKGKEGILQAVDQGNFYSTEWKEPTYSATMKRDLCLPGMQETI